MTKVIDLLERAAKQIKLGGLVARPALSHEPQYISHCIIGVRDDDGLGLPYLVVSDACMTGGFTAIPIHAHFSTDCYYGVLLENGQDVVEPGGLAAVDIRGMSLLGVRIDHSRVHGPITTIEELVQAITENQGINLPKEMDTKEKIVQGIVSTIPGTRRSFLHMLDEAGLLVTTQINYHRSVPTLAKWDSDWSRPYSLDHDGMDSYITANDLAQVRMFDLLPKSTSNQTTMDAAWRFFVKRIEQSRGIVVEYRANEGFQTMELVDRFVAVQSSKNGALYVLTGRSGLEEWSVADLFLDRKHPIMQPVDELRAYARLRGIVPESVFDIADKIKPCLVLADHEVYRMVAYKDGIWDAYPFTTIATENPNA